MTRSCLLTHLLIMVTIAFNFCSVSCIVYDSTKSKALVSFVILGNRCEIIYFQGFLIVALTSSSLPFGAAVSWQWHRVFLELSSWCLTRKYAETYRFSFIHGLTLRFESCLLNILSYTRVVHPLQSLFAIFCRVEILIILFISKDNQLSVMTL